MKLLNILFLFVGFIVILNGCVTSHKFRDSKTKILPENRISLDKIDTITALVVGFDYPDFDRYAVNPIGLASRPDSIFRYLSLKMSMAFGKQIELMRNSTDCNNKISKAIEETLSRNPVGSIQKRNFFIDSFTLRNCISFPQNKDVLLIIFRLETQHVGYSSLSVWDRFNGSFIYMASGRIEMFRQYRSNQLSQRRFFPKGSEDRDYFPHFPQRQIERVVDALVDDLKKRVQ